MLDCQARAPLTAAADNQLAAPLRFTPRFLVGRVLGEGAYGVVEICHERRSWNSPRGSPKVQLSPAPGVYDSNDRVRLVMELCESGDLLSLLLSKTKNLNKSVEKPRRRTSESSWPSLKKLSSLCRSRFRNSTGERPTGLPEHLAAGIFWQLVTAVQHCHSQRVVHRDIKLENVLLTSASPASKPSETDTCPFTVKLADFGTATILKPGIDFTMGNVGSAAYKAPEVSQDSYHGTLADVYSLGVVLYALLTSAFPNSGASKGTVTHRNPQDFIDNELTVHLSSGVKQLIAAMLTVDPAKRPTCSQVLEHPWVHTGR
ncbi:unnamed protein product [Closterium sp. NIES-64]|nr:unnamed protein product [Closterium sp. NIES-64]